MALKIVEAQVDAVKGETNIWDLDASIPIDPLTDQIWFTAKDRKSDLDSDAVLQYGLNVPGLSGIVVVDEDTGQFRVTSPEADLGGVSNRALMFDVKIKVAGTGVIQTVVTGTILLVENVNHDAT